MPEPFKETCKNCNGKGTVPHEKRIMPNGHPDPADFHLIDLCPKCGGGGKVEVNPKTITEHSSTPIVESFLQFCERRRV